jgi:hypothetical protein
MTNKHSIELHITFGSPVIIFDFESILLLPIAAKTHIPVVNILSSPNYLVNQADAVRPARFGCRRDTDAVRPARNLDGVNRSPLVRKCMIFETTHIFKSMLRSVQLRCCVETLA